VIDESIMLTCNHRQKDMTFLRMLDMVRLGIVTDKTIEMLKSRSIVEVKKREEVERRAIKQQVSVSASSSSLSSSSSSSLSSSSSSSTAAAVSDSAADSPDTKNATDVKQGAEAGDEFKVGVMKLFPTNAQVRFVNMEGE
jgi:cytoskeletal protein RodZ